jgi:zinc transporter, ZIP family
MSVWSALLWGGLASSSLFIGQALAGPLARSQKATGLLMGFGAGTLISAVGFELVPEASFDEDVGLGVGIALGLGALTYYVADTLVDRLGGEKRQTLGAGADAGSPWAMYIGALLDGVPESFVLGSTLALGGSIDVAFLAAVFVSNIPQGVAGTQSLLAAGSTSRKVLWGWGLLTVVSALFAGMGFLLADIFEHQGIYAEAFAGGAVLTMLADSMMPEAFRHGGRAVGLFTVLGYLVAAVLAVTQ